jgi:predicted RNase H-like HicB family nuclease
MTTLTSGCLLTSMTSRATSAASATYVTSHPGEHRQAEDVAWSGAGRPGTQGSGSISPYVEAALRHATLERLEDGLHYAEVPELPGVWAQGDSAFAALKELREVVEDWVVLKLRYGDHDFPALGSIRLSAC